jgi:hypothetical protein
VADQPNEQGRGAATPTDTLGLLRVTPDEYGSSYQAHFFDQYKLYVEMADRVSGRRMLANSFFLGVNTILITILSFAFKNGFPANKYWLLIPLIAILLLCITWWRIVKSYRQLNSGKYKVVGAMEQYLPCAPYDAEWNALGRGKQPKLYRPLTHVENWVPILFALLYVLIGVFLVA